MRSRIHTKVPLTQGKVKFFKCNSINSGWYTNRLLPQKTPEQPACLLKVGGKRRDSINLRTSLNRRVGYRVDKNLYK